jgi:hypothetical protein
VYSHTQVCSTPLYSCLGRAVILVCQRLVIKCKFLPAMWFPSKLFSSFTSSRITSTEKRLFSRCGRSGKHTAQLTLAQEKTSTSPVPVMMTRLVWTNMKTSCHKRPRVYIVRCRVRRHASSYLPLPFLVRSSFCVVPAAMWSFAQMRTLVCPGFRISSLIALIHQVSFAFVPLSLTW